MDYFLFIWSVSSYIEEHLKAGIRYDELEKAMGFSYRHIREVFKECTRVSLSRYILNRRITNAAFEMVHTGKSLTGIAMDYGFDSYDTFTRAFERETGVTPSAFRKGRFTVGRKQLNIGAYAPAILKENLEPVQPEWMEEVKYMNPIEKSDGSCILFGVPKVEYTFEECTPFPACLKAVLNYMGQKIDYSYLMASSGAAFRLRWNTKYWDGGNVDIQCIYDENRLEAFERSFRAAGRNYRILLRSQSDKEGFSKMIRSEIDSGRPVIALGIIGPPEACIITGYENNGDTLMGWNFFQTMPEFATDVKFHEAGYFMCSSWWENECTLMLMSVGEETVPSSSQKEIVQNGIEIMSRERIILKNAYMGEPREYAGGQAAYEAWANAVDNDREFPDSAILPLLFERLMCQNDAQVMVGEGRSYAAVYLDWLGRTYPAVSELCTQAAASFRKAAECAFQMNDPKGGFEQNESTVRKFAQKEVRSQIVESIRKAKQHEASACEAMKKMVELL